MSKTKKEMGSWKSLLNIYKTTKLPWAFLIMVVVCELGMQTLNVVCVPYASKIDTGNMDGWNFIIPYILLSISYCILENGYDYFNTMGRATLSKDVRKGLWGKMLRLPLSVYEKEEPQRYVSRVTKDTENTYAALTAVTQLITIIYGCVLAMIEVFKIYAGLSWIMIGVIPVLILASFVVGKMHYKMQNVINNAYSDVTNYYSERLPNITYIKTNNMTLSEIEKGRKINEVKYKADKVYWFLYTFILPISSMANSLCSVAVLVLASALVRDGQMEMSELISLSSYFTLVMNNANMFITVWQTIKLTHGGTEKIADIKISEEERLDGENIVIGQNDIRFENVSYGYLNDKIVLKDASFTIPKGKITAIVGENGSGKSTIMRLLEHFDVPQSGNIYVGNHDLSTINIEKWRDNIAYVFQGNQMVYGNVKDNIAYGLDNASDEMIIKAAKDAESYDFIMEKENQFNTEIEIFDPEFSGGQLQRLAIARAMLKNPEILLLDEATSGIDTVTESKIIETIKNMMKDKTLILIAHNMDLIEMADHIIVLKDGYVESEGSPSAVLQSSPTYQAFVQAS